MGFQLDTSGTVAHPTQRHNNGDRVQVAWKHLDPFTQGYVEALFAGPLTELRRDREDEIGMNIDPLAFSDLAPESLARIIEDCAAFQNFTAGLGFKTGAVEGRRFWDGRAAGLPPGPWGAAFPPLTAYLADDGKVYLREAA